MTTALPTATAEVATPADPHVSKIAPDDPRLRIRAVRGRTLKKGPAIALVVALGGTLAVSLIASLLPSPKGSETKKSEPESTASPPTPVVPDAIRNAPERVGPPRPPPPTDRLSVVSLPDDRSRRAAFAASSDDTLPPAEPAAPRAPSATRDLRAEENLRARASAILFEPQRGGATPSSAAPAANSAPAAPPLPFAEHGSSPGVTADTDPNLQARKNAFLDSEGATKTTDYLQTRLVHPRSPYEVKAGTVIPAVLITAISSDLPGPVVGQVRENVYDTTTGNFLLIPQGARLLAHYDSMVAWGQERVLVCWNRLIFPNGDSISLECMPAADLQGAAGLTDDVDEHWGRILKGVAVASLLAATTQAVAGNTEGFNPTVPQVWARGAAGEVGQAGQQITRRNISIQPTINIRAGFSVNVIVTKDLALPSPYPLDPPAIAHSRSRSAPRATPNLP
jgi:type IV secretory pathway VirB10-like protein